MMKPLNAVVVAADKVVKANDDLLVDPRQERPRERFQNCMKLFRLGSQCSNGDPLDGNQVPSRAWPLGRSSLMAIA